MVLTKYNLEYEQAFKYVHDNLEGTNALSSALLRIIDFQKGSFFTLLPDGSNIERLYEFEAGVILPQNPDIEYISKNTGEKNTYSLIPKIDDELSEVIFAKMISDNNLCCIIDDVTLTPEENYFDCLIPYKHHIDEELYYILEPASITSDLIKHGLNASNAFWHSLCIISNLNYKNIQPELSLDQIKEMCNQAQIVIIGAYDSETYIFWMKNGCSFFRNQNDL